MELVLFFLMFLWVALALAVFGSVFVFSGMNAKIYREIKQFSDNRSVSLQWEDFFRKKIGISSQSSGYLALIGQILRGKNIFDLSDLSMFGSDDDRQIVATQLNRIAKNYARALKTLFLGIFFLFMYSIFLALAIAMSK